MSLSSLQLDAFVVVATTLHFSQAAEKLHITQSALSQRIGNLEKDLGLTLFLRHRKGVQLTESGAQLLRYCQTRDALEAELLGELRAPDKKGLSGVVRIGGYSSIMRSAVLPAIAPLLREFPQLRLQSVSREVRELPETMRRGEVDFILLDYQWESAGVESVAVGHEEYVLATSATLTPPTGVYLDHDAEDTTTEKFFRRQTGKTPQLARSYLDEIYSLMDGVALGLGQAVIPRHLLALDARLRAVAGSKPYRVSVFLHYYAQPYYSKLHQRLVAELSEKLPATLS